MHLLDEQISLTDGNVFVFAQNPKSWICEAQKKKQLTIDLNLSLAAGRK